MSKITYEDKVTLHENTLIADNNKCRAEDLNEIKTVVNGLDDSVTTNKTNIATNKTNIATNKTNIATNKTNIGTLSSLTTSSKTNLVNAINEVNTNVLKPTTLYTYTGSTAQSSLTLSDTYTNYKYIEIYGARNGMWSYTKFIPSLTSNTEFPNVGQNGNYLEIQTTKMKFSGISVTLSGVVVTWDATSGVVAGKAVGVETVIKRIIGWK